MAANGYLKVVDEDEARRLLIVEGKSLRWMVEFYREKYGVKTSHQMWSRLRALWSGMKGHEGHSFDMSTGVPRGVLAVPWTTPLTVENPDLRDALSGLSACYWGLWDKNGGPSDRRYRKLYSFVSRCLIGDLVVDYVSDPYPSFRLVERLAWMPGGFVILFWLMMVVQQVARWSWLSVCVVRLCWRGYLIALMIYRIARLSLAGGVWMRSCVVRLGACWLSAARVD